MRKDRTKNFARKVQFASERPASASQKTRPWGALSPRAGLLELVLAEGFEGVMQTLKEEREALCGPERRWQPDRLAYRYGYDSGRLVLGGRTVRLPQPRVRSVEGRELELPVWRRFSEEDPLSERVLQQILAGVSARKYAGSLERVPEELEPGTTSASSVSRRFVALTRRRVEQFLSRSLGELDLPVILIDGTPFGEHLVVTAMGTVARNVKRWRGGSMVLRWVVTGLVEAEKRFRCIKGHRELPQLIAALVTKNEVDRKEQVA